jgi:plasmid stabilization system protein ParE
MARLIYSEEALADLERLVDFLIEAAPDAAVAALDSILAALDLLRDHPLLGHRLDRIRRELVISHGATGYVAAYRYQPGRDLVRVLRIRHQREVGCPPL